MSNKLSFSKEHFKGDPLDRDLYTSSQIKERALNAAIVEADIEQGYEKYLAIFDAFYGDEIEVSSETSDEPIRGKDRVRSLLGNFLYPVHVMAEVGGLIAKIRATEIARCCRRDAFRLDSRVRRRFRQNQHRELARLPEMEWLARGLRISLRPATKGRAFDVH
jgi:hypothetical protein